MSDLTVTDVLLYTQDMMVTVIDQKWDVLDEMQIKQDKMLRQLLTNAGEVFLVKEKENLLEVQRLNQEILNATERCRTDVAGKLKEIRAGKAKAKIYQSF